MKADEILAQVLDRIEKEILRIQEGNAPEDSDAAETIRVLEEIIFDAQQDKKPKGTYNLTYDTDGVATCQVLRQEMAAFYKEHPDKYPLPMYTEFLRYWSEPNSKGVPRWYSEKNKPRGRFFLPGRLATWGKNYRPPKIEPKPLQHTPSNIPDDAKMKFV